MDTNSVRLSPLLIRSVGRRERIPRGTSLDLCFLVGVVLYLIEEKSIQSPQFIHAGLFSNMHNDHNKIKSRQRQRRMRCWVTTYWICQRSAVLCQVVKRLVEAISFSFFLSAALNSFNLTRMSHKLQQSEDSANSTMSRLTFCRFSYASRQRIRAS